MKKAVMVFLVILFMISFIRPAYCDSPMKKLGRGMANILTCLLEVPEQMKIVNNTDGPIAASTYGVIKGFAMTGLRAIVGAYEVVTFPIPSPKGNYGPILTDPEFFFADQSG